MKINKQLLVGLVVTILLLGGVGVSIFLSQQQTDVRQRAAGVTPPPACVSNQATCAWDPVINAITYHYKIIDVGTSAVISEGDVQNPTTQIAFTSQANKTYKCIVNALNSCGAGPEGQATATCSISPTPTVTGVPPTPTATPPVPPTSTPVPPTPTPTTPVPTATGCPLPAQVNNVRITCPNCAP